MERVSDEYLNRLIALSESQCLSKLSSSEVITNQLLKILYELKYRRSMKQEKGGIMTNSKPIPVKRCKIDGAEQDVKEWAVKQWFAKINEELDELKVALIRWDDDDADIAITDEAADTITVITSMLEAMGFDENQRNEAQQRVNEKNRLRERL